MRRILLVLALVLVLPANAQAATLGEQRVLLMPVTWGPEPYTPAALRASLDETSAYMRSVSFGKTWIVGQVTPWLHALPSRPGCDTARIAQAAQSAATAAGYDLSSYTTLGIAMPHLATCPWGGAYFPPGIWLNGRNDRHVIAHELGHTYGIAEEGSAWICDPRCQAVPYANPFSVMGHGWSDFGGWEKHQFGWLDRIAAPPGRVTLGALDRPGLHPHAMRVITAGEEHWFEYRPPAPLWDYGPFLPAQAATSGVVVHAGANQLGEASRFPGRNYLIYDPVGRGRPAVRDGETYSLRGVFSVSVGSTDATTAMLTFRWTDRTRPGRPRLLPAKPRRGRLALRWRRGVERGSGIAAHEVFLDGRRVARVSSTEEVGALLIPAEDRVTVRVRAGRHVVRLVAVDRAGNRSRPAQLVVH